MLNVNWVHPQGQQHILILLPIKMESTLTGKNSLLGMSQKLSPTCTNDEKNIWRFEEELFSRFTVSNYRESLSVCERLFSFGFKDRMSELVVLVPDHCFVLYPYTERKAGFTG